MGKVIFGDNQFLGVNHYSTIKSEKYLDKFSDKKEIADILNFSVDIGIEHFMFTTTDKYHEVFDILNERKKIEKFKLMPCLPYAQNINNIIASSGYSGLIKKILKSVRFSALLWAFKNFFKHGIYSFMVLILNLELERLKRFNIDTILMQNAFFDIILATENHNSLKCFIDICTNYYSAKPGIITMNYSKAIEFFEKHSISTSLIVCSNFNKDGYRMNPSKESCENSLKKTKYKTIAMSVFAGDASIDQKIEYIKGLEIDYILFGSSKKKNILNNYNCFNE